MLSRSRSSSTDGKNQNFLKAARAGNHGKISEYLKYNLDINSITSKGLNALHLAAKEGHLKVVQLLLDNGAKPDLPTKKGNTALHIASLAGHFDIVKSLIDNKANVNIQSQNGFTPLYMAAQENHKDIVEYLLEKGANQTLLTEDGFSPLAVALQQGHDKIVTLLLERDDRSKIRLPALHIAAKKDDVNAVKLFLNNTSVNVDHTSSSGFTPLHIASHYGNKNMILALIEHGADVNFKAKSNITPLHLAAKWGKQAAISALLSSKAEVDSRTRDGLTPLHCAARSGHVDALELLLKANANPASKTKSGLSPLHMAAQGDHMKIAKILLSKGVPVDCITTDYLTPLHVASHCGSVNISNVLLQKKADVNSRALNGFTALHIACKKQQIPIIELLLKNGADINFQNNAGLTPLHIAALVGSKPGVDLLLKNKANLNILTNRSETPLHLAVRSQKVEVVSALLKQNASSDIFDCDNLRPLDIAIKLGNQPVSQLLIEHPQTEINYASIKDKMTPLHLAAKEGTSPEIVDLLIRKGAHLEAKNKRGYKPIHLAAKSGNVKIFNQILNYDNSQLNAKSNSGYTPLHLAANFNKSEVVQSILNRNNSEINASSKNNVTPLHLAIKNSNAPMAKSLISAGADLNAKTSDGLTPLHMAALRGQDEVTRVIMEKCSDQSIAQDVNHLTPIHLAAMEDNAQCLRLLLNENRNLEKTLKTSNFSPLHLAAYYGQLNSVKTLVEFGIKTDLINEMLDARTKLGNNPLHIAAQQGHTLVIQRILEAGSQPDSLNQEGWTAAQIANKRNFQKIFEKLSEITTNVTEWNKPSSNYENSSCELTLETPDNVSLPILSDSDGESSDTSLTPVTLRRKINQKDFESLKYETLCKSMEYMRSNEPQCETLRVSSNQNTEARIISNESLGKLQLSDGDTYSVGNSIMPTSNQLIKLPTLDQPKLGNQITEWNFDSEINSTKKRPFKAGFLVSFLVDARGCQVEAKRKMNLKFFIPPNATNSPTRIVCRLIRPDLSMTRPMLNDGDALACRLLELGPYHMKFDTPVMLEIPHVASLRGREREVLVLRSDNGDTWKEHTIDASDQAISDIIGNKFGNIESTMETSKKNVQRIITNDFPQYFALISRFRQEIALVGPEGGVICSTVVPQVQAMFPKGSLQKKIKIGLQSHVVPMEIINKYYYKKVAVSPIVSIEPRRRKFHKPITVTIPLPKFPRNLHPGSQHKENIRLLCSISGGTASAFWEDITGTTHLSRHKECASFTTTVSARLWLIDAVAGVDVTEAANELYKESIIPPYLGKFVLFSKDKKEDCCPVSEEDGENSKDLRCMCLIDDKIEKSLEERENYKLINEGPQVEVIEDQDYWLEDNGNIEIIKKSYEKQAKINVKAFKENRATYKIRKRQLADDFSGNITFMKESKESIEFARGKGIRDECFVTPVTSFNVKLGLHQDQYTSSGFNDISKAEIDTTKLSQSIGKDWRLLGQKLGVSEEDLLMIEKEPITETSQKDVYRCIQTLKIWEQKTCPDISNEVLGNKLADTLKEIGREDLIKSHISNVQLVTDAEELKKAEKLVGSDITNDKVQRRTNLVHSSSGRKVTIKTPFEGKEVGLDGRLTRQTGESVADWIGANLNQDHSEHLEQSRTMKTTSFGSYDSEYTMTMTTNDLTMETDGNKTPTNEIDDSELYLDSMPVDELKKTDTLATDYAKPISDPSIDLITSNETQKTRSRFDLFSKFKKTPSIKKDKKMSKKDKTSETSDHETVSVSRDNSQTPSKGLNFFKRFSRSRSASKDPVKKTKSKKDQSKERETAAKHVTTILNMDVKNELNDVPKIIPSKDTFKEETENQSIATPSNFPNIASNLKNNNESRPVKKLKGKIIPVEIMPPIDNKEQHESSEKFLEQFLNSTSRPSRTISERSRDFGNAFTKENLSQEVNDNESTSDTEFKRVYEEAVMYQQESPDIPEIRGEDIVEGHPEEKIIYEEKDVENLDGTKSKIRISEQEHAQAISFREWQEGLQAAIEAGYILQQEPEEITEIREIDELLPDGTVVTRIITTKRIIERLTENIADEDIYYEGFDKNDLCPTRMLRVTD